MAVRGKVLIVEDDRAISNFIRRVLEANGYEALMVHTGREANSMLSVSYTHLTLTTILLV